MENCHRTPGTWEFLHKTSYTSLRIGEETQNFFKIQPETQCKIKRNKSFHVNAFRILQIMYQ